MKTRVLAVAIALCALCVPLRSAAAPRRIPIDHVVVLMNENRSTDSYFAHLHDILPAFEAQPAGAANPNPMKHGAVLHPFHQTSYCEPTDLDHSWLGSHRQYDIGRMDGFTLTNMAPEDRTGSRTMGYYTRSDLPYYYSLYSTYATSDRYFASLMGPTYPNRFFLFAATSWGMTSNDLATNPSDFAGRSIFNLLDAKHVSWKVYFTEIPFSFEFAYVRAHAADHVFPISQYYADAAAGNLPQVTFLDPGYFGTRNTETDEHPPANVQTGQLATSKLVSALTSSPNWSSSAMFITYDEHGGYYDHVKPPKAAVPDRFAAKEGHYRFDSYGFRVPVVAISPYARPHFVSHVVEDHTSILKFIETRFGLPSLTKRDAAADAMLGMFDFSHASFGTPATLTPATIDAAHAEACQQGDVTSSGAPNLEP